MQHPVGMAFNPDTVRNEMNDFAAVALSPTAVVKFLHTVSSGWLTGAVFVIGVSCWFLIKQRNRNMALRSIKVASLTGIVAGLIVLGTGDQSGVVMAREQPMKLAAAEGLQQGGQRAPISIVPGIEVPGALSVLATHSIDGYVPGINDLLNGYKRPDGTSEPSADEKCNVAKRLSMPLPPTVSCVPTIRRLPSWHSTPLGHISNIWAMAISRISPNLCRLHLLYIGPFV